MLRTLAEVRNKAYLTVAGGVVSVPASLRRRVLLRIRMSLRRLLLIEHSPFMTL